jgi:hypothetical protein
MAECNGWIGRSAGDFEAARESNRAANRSIHPTSP